MTREEGNSMKSEVIKEKRGSSLSRKRVWNLIWKYRYLYLLLLPGIIYFVVFKYAPLYGISIAFKDYKIKAGIMASPWVGLDNFKMIFRSTTFFTVLKNTVALSFYKLLFGFPAPIILALILNEIKSVKYKKAVQTITYMPHFLSWVVVSGLFLQILSPSSGPVAYIFKMLHLQPIYFLGDPSWFRFTMVTTGMWKSIGWDCIIYLAALSGIDPQLYEAAIIDGATRFQRIRYVTIPSIMPIVVILLIMNSGKLIDDNFDQIFNFLNDAVLSKGDVISTYVYRMGLVKMKYSYSTAVDLFKNIVAFSLVFTTNKIAKKAGEEGIW